MLKIRLKKTGKRNAPSYRVVVIPEECPRGGRAVEILGHFNPSTSPPLLMIRKKRLQYWLEQGAQMTEAVEKLVKGKYEFKKYTPRAGKGGEKAKKEPGKTEATAGTEVPKAQRPQSEALRPKAVPKEPGEKLEAATVERGPAEGGRSKKSGAGEEEGAKSEGQGKQERGETKTEDKKT